MMREGVFEKKRLFFMLPSKKQKRRNKQMKDNNNKKEFTVSIMETVTEDFIVKADSMDEAIEIAKQ